jgi:hypothetical protein
MGRPLAAYGLLSAVRQQQLGHELLLLPQALVHRNSSGPARACGFLLGSLVRAWLSTYLSSFDAFLVGFFFVVEGLNRLVCVGIVWGVCKMFL